MSNTLEIPVERYRGYLLMEFSTRCVIRSPFEQAYVAEAPTMAEARNKINNWLDDPTGES